MSRLILMKSWGMIMRKLLNTLFVTKENAYLALDGETIIVEESGKKIGQFPLINLEDIICFSYKGASPALMGKCAEKGIGISFFTPYGKFLCRISDNDHGNVLLRRQQYRIADSETASVGFARNNITGKLYNSKWTIARTVRDHELRINAEKCRRSIGIINGLLKRVSEIEDIDSLRGIEGDAALWYFDSFDEMILNQKNEFTFCGRTRRPPLDKVNAMLSFGYSLLSNDCANALQSVGLDPYVGFMHKDRPGRKSLSLDLMEELRTIMVDRFVITMINLKQVSAKHFVKMESGATEFTDEGKKLFLSEWQKRKQEEIIHPYLKEKIKWGLVPYVQALLLARNIRGDIDGYPPFLWK